MNRRDFLKNVGTVPFLPHFIPRLLEGSHAVPTHRVRPQDPGWPAAAAWEQLNQQVGGRLRRLASPLDACVAEPRSAECLDMLQHLQNPFFISEEPSATQISGWVGAWKSAPSTYAVTAANAGDVAATVNFAREHNLRLVVKGGGHSYQGTSNSADSLLIWTRGMKDIVLHDAFVAKGCAGVQGPQPAVTVGAGAIWVEVYHAVTTQAGRYVQGGGCTTVGVAGLIQSGGFGSFSKNFGLAASGLLEAEIVTADGSVRTANACTHPDLFWAIKGGGGGSFGVVTKLTLKTHELPPVFGAVITSIKANSDAAFLKLIDRFVAFYRDALFNPFWGESISIRPDNVLAVKMLFHSLETKRVEEIWRPFLEWVAASPEDFTVTMQPLIGSIPARNWWDAQFLQKNLPQMIHLDPRQNANPANFWWAGDDDQVSVFIHGYESAWLSASLLEEEQREHLTNALFRGSRHWTIALHFNKGLAGAPASIIEAARHTATNPVAVDAFALAIIGGGSAPVFAGHPGLPGYEPEVSRATREAKRIAQSMKELAQVVPHASSYVSESNFFNDEWQQAFWGNQYSRLRVVKTEYDPAGLFFVRHGVGSEEWSPDGFTRLSER